MKNKKTKTFLLVMLLILLIGVVSATEVSNDTTTTTDEVVQNTPTTTNTVEKSVTDNTLKDNKEITKEDKNIKTASKTYDISNFDSLYDALTNDDYNTVTVNIKSNIKLTDNTILSRSINTLTINGNNKTINGDNKYQFLNIQPESSVKINNIVLKNCYDRYGGTILNFGNLTIVNSTICDNNGSYTIIDDGVSYPVVRTYYAAIYNAGSSDSTANLTMINCVMKNNSAMVGAAITNDDGSLCNIINCTFENNYGTSSAGAIYNGYSSNLNVSNSVFKNNNASDTAAIRNFYLSNASISNSYFYNNYAKSNGGAVSNYQANMTITNCTFDNNKANGRNTSVGGAIYNYEGNLNITKSILTNNIATTAGALFNSRGDLNATNNTFINNTAELTGGAIRSVGGILSSSYTSYSYGQATGTTYHVDYYGNLFADKNIFINNSATNGGAIAINITKLDGLTNEDTISHNNLGILILNSKFINNTADSLGGAVYLEEGNYTGIINDTFEYNEAQYGGAILVADTCEDSTTINYNNFTGNYARTGAAIYNKGTDVFISYNNFKQNIANSIESAIIDNSYSSTINNNLNANTSPYNSTIYTEGNNIRITYNNFTGKTNSKLSIKASNNKPEINNQITITATLTDVNNNKLSNQNIIITINNKNYTIKTNSNGIATQTYTPTAIGTQTIKATYKGNNIYNSSNTSAKITVKNRTAVIQITSPKTIQTGKNATFKVTVTDASTKQKLNGTVIIKVNGLTLKDNNNKNIQLKVVNGQATLNYSLRGYSARTHNVTVVFAKTNYNRGENSINMTVTKANYQAFTYTFTACSEKTITINKTLKDANGNILAGNNRVAIKVGDRTVLSTLTKDGVLNAKFTIPYLPQGKINVTITLGENYRYNMKRFTTTATIYKQNVTVTINKITAKKGSKITLKALLKNSQTKTNVLSGKYIFKVNGVQVPLIQNNKEVITTKIISNGTAQWDYQLPNNLKAGVYEILLSYNGNTQSNPIRVTSKALTITA